MTRKALVVGIDYYTKFLPLVGCVNDAYSVKTILERNGDGSVNFGVMLLTGTGASDLVSKGALKDRISELFATDSETALLYFAGHGWLESTGGYLLAGDANRGDDGLALNDILTLAAGSKAKNKVVVLDACHSGVAGTLPIAPSVSQLAEGMTILTASTADQYSTEEHGKGTFTTLLVDALSGGAANLLGDITPGSVYAHIDQSLGAWDQRPVFKTNVKSFVSLRKVEASISLSELRRLTEFFPSPGSEFQLDPSFEPEMKGRHPGAAPPDPANVQKFAILQKYNRHNLLVPVGAPHMWYAAMESKTCKLKVLGEHYRSLVARGLI